jgi:hypothetical protein
MAMVEKETDWRRGKRRARTSENETGGVGEGERNGCRNSRDAMIKADLNRYGYAVAVLSQYRPGGWSLGSFRTSGPKSIRHCHISC